MKTLFVALLLLVLPTAIQADEPSVRVATFDVDATPSVGMPMAYDPVKRVDELTLRCRGIVLLGGNKPIVLCAVDWIGIANEGQDVFRDALAAAAGTTRDHVAVHTLHQHDAPGCDFTAERIIRELGIAEYGRFEGGFHREVIQRTAEAIKSAIAAAQPVTDVGFGKAEVKEVASNRRIMGPDGKVRAVRYTATRDEALRAEPEGVIDPEVSELSFWNKEKPVAVLSFYACHPQSYYRTGIPSPDFPGIARFIRGQAVPEALHVHFNGAGGNIGAGKYNDGSKENRLKLATRLADGMQQAYQASKKQPLTAKDIGWQVEPISLPPAAHLDQAKLIESLKAEPAKGYISKADQLAWLQRCLSGHKIDIACLSVANNRVLFMPGELFVEYQLSAKKMRPDLNVAMAAYGEYGPGYIGTEVAYAEGGYETGQNASSVAPTSEQILTRAMQKLLDPTRDTGAQLRVPPRSPQEAIASFEIRDGFEMQLVAAEPDVLEPILISYDEDGAMYACEFLKFPAKGGKSNGPDGRIRRLQDRDGDGVYETSQVFATDLAWPTGICSWKGGVYVIAAPDLWYLKDSDGDGQADLKEKLFSGFGFTTEEGTANSLIWGLDQWIYGAGSHSGGDIVNLTTPSAAPVSIRGRDFRFHPVTREFQAISGSEQFGNTFDDWGNRFICQNSKPAVAVVLPAHYLARNPFLAVPTVLQNAWSDTTIFRSSPTEAWRLARTKMRLKEKPNWTGPSVEHDVFTACTGITVYRGSAYPTEFRGNLFLGEVQGNLVHRRLIQPDSVTFKTVRADEQSEFLRSPDNWFRPANLCNAPDGTLHVVDMYREIIETPDSMPDEILAMVDLRSGADRGRVYRIAPKGFKPTTPKVYSKLSTAQLVAELESPNGWSRDTASRLLFERQDAAAVKPLRELLRSTKSDVSKAHVLWTLRGLNQLTNEDALLGLKDSSPRLREQSVRLAESLLAKSSGTQTANMLLDEVIKLAEDEDARVRFQVAFSLGESSDRRVAGALAKLSKRDANDRWMRTAILSSSLNVARELLAELLADEEFALAATSTEMLRQLATMVGGRNQAEELTATLQSLSQNASSGSNNNALRTTLLGLGDGLRRSGGSLAERLKKYPQLTAAIDQMVVDARKTLEADSVSPPQIQQAFAVLSLAPSEVAFETSTKLLDSRRSPSVQLGAVQLLAAIDSGEVPSAVIKAWNGLSPSVRREAIEVLLSRSRWTGALLDAVSKNQISSSFIESARRQALLENADPKIKASAHAIFAADRGTPRSEVVDNYRSALSLNGDSERGRLVYEKNCMACHKLGTKGFEVGPNLATIQNRTPEQLLIQILDPNRDVLASYTQYNILLDTDRVVTGLIASESPTSITLRRAEGIEETVLRQSIEKITGSGKSIMPEGLEQNVDQQSMADLVTYLLTVLK